MMTRFTPPRRATHPLRLAVAVGALYAVACGGARTGPPEIVLDRSACDACGMLISDPAYAASYRAGRRTAVFDDIGCLLRGLDDAGDATDTAVWFLDSDQQWIEARDAVFVRSAELPTPMGGHIQAFADRGEAERTAAGVGGVIVEGFSRLR